jgi:hypothetical protein
MTRGSHETTWTFVVVVGVGSILSILMAIHPLALRSTAQIMNCIILHVGR